MMTRLLLLPLLAGCYLPPGQFSDKPGQDEAIDVVMSLYGSDARPRVSWAEGDDLDCVVPSNGKAGFTTPAGCLEGWTWNPLYVTAAYRDGDRMCDTALAHELAHLALLRRFRIDRNHTDPKWWGPGGKVQGAFAALTEMSL